jgi:transposase
MNDLGLRQHIDQWVPVDRQCRTTVGEAVQLLVLDMLSGRNALVNVDKWAVRQDIELLLRPGLQASWINDDALGRHLDRLHEADMHQVYSSFQLHVYRHERIPMSVFHGDTTSMSVYGAYTKPSQALQIVEGYSRDRRGANQIQFGLIGNVDGIPLYGDVHDGNTSDKAWNPDVLNSLQAQCAALNLEDFLYVADSAAISKETLAAAKGASAYLLTRAPNHLKIVKAALEAADAKDAPWTEKVTFVSSKEGAPYRWLASEAKHEGHSLRLIVVESSVLDKKKDNTLKREREAESVQFTQAAKEAATVPFHCLADAEQAAEAFRKGYDPRFHHLEVMILPQEVIRKKRGSPKQGEVPHVETVYVYGLQTTITPDETRFQEARRRASCFVLALTIYQVLQLRIRQHITEQQPMRGAGGRILRKPTPAAIFQIFKYQKVAVLRLPDVPESDSWPIR